MEKLTWDELLARPDFRGGKLEFQDGIDVMSCGPLLRIEQGDEAGVTFYYFHTAWRAAFDVGKRHWTIGANLPISIRGDFKPNEMREGLVWIGEPPHVLSLHRRGSEPLPTVIGLTPPSQRLLALYPKLPFDRAKAEQICRSKGATCTAERVRQLPDHLTVQALMELFTVEAAAEEFLWNYIEALTGEKEVHRQVY